MKTKLTMMVAAAMACAAVQLAAMPTEEEARRAEPVVKKLLAQERAALESGKKTRSEVAAAAMKLADEADTDAAKLLLMKGAFAFYVKDGNLEKAVETMNALETAIADMPPQSVTNMIEMALKGASKKVDGERLYKLLNKTKAGIASHSMSKEAASVSVGVASVTEKARKDIARLFPGWSLASEVPQRAEAADHYSGFYASHRGQDNIIRLQPSSGEQGNAGGFESHGEAFKQEPMPFSQDCFME